MRQFPADYITDEELDRRAGEIEIPQQFHEIDEMDYSFREARTADIMDAYNEFRASEIWD